MWWMVSLLLVLLWIIGLLLERMFSRQARLAGELEKKEKMALIGQMTAVLAHEIRNALGGIKGYTQWVAEKMEPTDHRKNGLSFALQGAERIETLVNDLLHFSREETYTLEEGLLEPLIQEVIALDVPHWGGRIQLEVEKGTMVKGDRDKIKRVLANGLQNALQAMGEEGRLRIVGRPDGRWVEIRLEDTGPGISPESQPKLFTPFYTTKASGTGLGLAYSKKVIEGMGGTITLRNLTEGPGASLNLRLPRAEGH
jgi:two-component system sensor histidine kinase HydH